MTLPFTANFFGTTYSDLYVNNNGNVTFGASSSQFTPVGLGTEYRGLPIIAPFFADVDTSNSASGITSYGTGTFAGRAAFGVTWPSVGYFSGQADKTNTFQLILTNRGDTGGGNFDIYFNYNSIKWETGDADGGTGGLGGTSASAGFSAGTGAAGTYYELPGSLVNGAFLDGGPNALATGTNNGVPGQFLFPVRNGIVLVANVCQTGDNASTTTVANCGPNQTYNEGIFYTPTGTFTLNVLANTTIEALPESSAVLVMPASGDGVPSNGNVSVNIDPTATIRSANGAGIEIDGTYSFGNIAVTNAGTITAGTDGIYAHGEEVASIALSNAAGATIQAGRIGMVGASNIGQVSVTNSGVVNAGYAGLVAGSLYSDPAPGVVFGVGVSVANSGQVNFGQFGILAGNAYGSTTITNSGALTQTGTPSAPPSLTDLPVFYVAGIAALGTDTYGIAAATVSGPLSILNDTAGTITGQYGIAATSLGSQNAGGPILGGSISVENRGSINAAISGVVVGTMVPSEDPETNVSSGKMAANSIAVTNSGTIVGGVTGVYGFMAPGTDVTVANSGAIAGGSLGILLNQIYDPRVAATSGAITVDNAKGASIQGDIAIAVDTYDGAVTLRNAGTIAGGTRGISATNNFFELRANASVPATFAPASSLLTIQNLSGGTIGASSGQALSTYWDGTINVSNAGTIAGYATFAPASTGSATGPAVTFDNLAGGIFAASGTSNFGGSGVFNNAGTVLLVSNEAGTADKLAGSTGASTFAASASTATFAGLSEFRNSGTISLANGYAGDTFVIGGNYVGQNGRLVLDFSTQTSTADHFAVNGNASGTTGVTIANLTSAVPFTTSPHVVTVNGTVAANAFTLAPLQNFGTLEGTLTTTTADGVTSLSLGAVPTALGLAGPTATVAARTISYQGGQAVLDRMSEVRQQLYAPGSGQTVIPALMQYTGLSQYSALVSKDPIAPMLAPPPAPSNVKPAVWARGFGDYESRSGLGTFNFNGNSFKRDLGYTQSSGGFLGGADVIIKGLSSAGDALVLGVMGGYTVAGVRLADGAGHQSFVGGTVGAYGTYLRGPFFLDALFKADFLDLDITGSGLRQSNSLQNYNFTSNVGYRVPLQNNVYIEPTAGVEYVNSNFGQQTVVTGSTVALQDGEAVRVRGGARVGTESIVGDIRIEPSITGYAYSVVYENGLGGAFNGATPVTGLKEEGKVRGEVQASINVFNLKTGVSAFVRGDGRFGQDLAAGGGRVGVRYQW